MQNPAQVQALQPTQSVRMKKRQFLSLGGAAGLLLPSLPVRAESPTDEPVLLTVSGAVGKPNRGPVDHVIDQMMGKHGIEFTQATTFTASGMDICALTPVTTSVATTCTVTTTPAVTVTLNCGEGMSNSMAALPPVCDCD